jgi:hypothetical protein
MERNDMAQSGLLPLTDSEMVYDRRRAAFHTLFIKKVLLPCDPLFALLADLIGLNLQTGEYYITGEFDPKHLCKHKPLLLYPSIIRFLIDRHSGLSTLLRTICGMLVNDVAINRNILQEFFVLLPRGTHRKKPRHRVPPPPPPRGGVLRFLLG